MKFKYLPETLGIILCLAIGMTGAVATNSSYFSWYAALNKPSFNPPNWVFAPTWTLLYILMGIALGELWKVRATNPGPWYLFWLQLLFNALWSPLFFDAHQIAWALADIFALWLSVSVLILKVWRLPILARWLLLPYGLWVSFALILNINLYLLN